MQQKWLWHGVKGWEEVSRYAYRMNEISDTAKLKLKALAFWSRHGLAATLDAFNEKLLDYLIWFNEERPPYPLNLQLPMEFLKNQHQCNMHWRDTIHS